MGSSGVQVEGNIRLGGRVRQVCLQERHLGRESVEEVRLSKVTREFVQNLQGERDKGNKERLEWVRRKWTEGGGEGGQRSLQKITEAGRGKEKEKGNVPEKPSQIRIAQQQLQPSRASTRPLTRPTRPFSAPCLLRLQTARLKKRKDA